MAVVTMSASAAWPCCDGVSLVAEDEDFHRRAGFGSENAPSVMNAVRMVLDHAHQHASQWATIRSVAEKLGCTTEALRRWVITARADVAAERPADPVGRQLVSTTRTFPAGVPSKQSCDTPSDACSRPLPSH
jgi:transposase-like protein